MLVLDRIACGTSTSGLLISRAFTVASCDYPHVAVNNIPAALIASIFNASCVASLIHWFAFACSPLKLRFFRYFFHEDVTLCLMSVTLIL